MGPGYGSFEDIADKAGDVTRFYTDGLIEEANNFRQGREMTPERVAQLLARRRSP